jgi:hypothetical protein
MCVCLTVCGGQKPENLGFYMSTGAAKVCLAHSVFLRVHGRCNSLQHTIVFKSACMLAAKIQYAGRNNVYNTHAITDK